MTTLRHNVDLPARPRSAHVILQRVGADIEFRRPRPSRFSTGFLWFWLAGWTVICALLVLLAARDPRPAHLFFGVPFWFLWVYVLHLLVDCHLGRESLRITPHGLRHTRSTGVPIIRRSVPAWEIGNVVEFTRLTDRLTGEAEHGIRIETSGKPICFALGASVVERAWLMLVIRAQLGVLNVDDEAPCEFSSATAPPAPDSASQPASESRPKPATQRFLPTRWCITAGRAGPRLIWRGRIPWRMSLCLVLAAFALAGIAAWLFLATKRYPFSIIVGLMLAAEVFAAACITLALIALSMRFWRREWIFGPDEIITRTSLFGICYTRWHPIEGIARLATVRERRLSRRPDLRAIIMSFLVGHDRSLLLLNERDETITKIRALAPNEARWIASRFRRAYSHRLDHLSA